jgi:hypothetical protein
MKDCLAIPTSKKSKDRESKVDAIRSIKIEITFSPYLNIQTTIQTEKKFSKLFREQSTTTYL